MNSNASIAPIRRYAFLQLAVQHNRAIGAPVNSEWVSEMQRLESWARATYTPQQLQYVGRLIDSEKVRYMDGARATQEERRRVTAQHDVDRALDLTDGLFNREQVAAVANGKKIPKQKKLTQSERDALFRDRTRSMDPEGRGWGEAEYERRLDALADAAPEQFQKLAGNYHADPRQLRQVVSKWKEDRIEHGLMKRRQNHDRIRGLESETPDEPNEWQRRRAQIANAYMNRTADRIDNDTRHGRASDHAREVEGRFADSTLNETDNDGQLTRRAVLARSYSEGDSDE